MYEDWTNENTPDRIRAILKAIRRRQSQLAVLLGISPVTVSRWMTGKHCPDPRSRAALERIEEKYIYPFHKEED